MLTFYDKSLVKVIVVVAAMNVSNPGYLEIKIDKSRINMERKILLELVAKLNDSFRRGDARFGVYQVTPLVQALSEEKLVQLINRVKAFNQFNPSNDPYGLHDFGTIEFDDESYCWEISYLDEKSNDFLITGASCARRIANRVFTLMHATER